MMTPRTLLKVIGTLLLAALAACGGSEPKASPAPAGTATARPSVSSSPSPKPPAKPETRWVLYLQDEGAEEPRTLYRARLDGSERTRIPVAVEREWVFEISRDGRFVAAWNRSWLGVMAAAGTSFTTLVTEKRPDHSFRGVEWASDGSALAYVVTHELKPGDPSGRQDNTLAVVPRAGGTPKLVRSFSRPAYVSLLAFDAAAGTVWWNETGEGGFHKNLTAVTVADGSVSVLPGSPSGEVPGLQLTSDQSRGYVLSEDRLKILEYSPSSGKTRTIYEVTEPGKDAHGNQTSITGMELAGDASRIVFSIHNEPSNKEISMEVALSSETAKVLVDDPKLYNVGVRSISSESRYVWLETDCHGCGADSGFNNEGEYYIKDLASGSLKTFMRIPRQNGIVEQGIRLVGWLTA